jgi:hypothetical protein
MSHDEIRIPNPWNSRGPETRCDIDIFDHIDGNRIVLVHERADNLGVSITNAAEKIYAFMVRNYNADYVVEFYDDASYEGGRGGKATYDLVKIDRNGHAFWKHLGSSREETIDNLITFEHLEAP